MKPRVKGNALRLRLTRPEMMRLHDDGLVRESAVLCPGATLTCRFQSPATRGPVLAGFQHGAAAVIVASGTAQARARGDTGIYAGAGGPRTSVQKDLRCLACFHEEEEQNAFPCPAETAVDEDGGTTCRL